MHIKTLVLSCCVALVAASASAQTTYRWVDPATGRTVISDQPPPPNAKIVNTQKGEQAPESNTQSFATRRATEKFPVVLYTAANCTEHCNNARNLLNKRGVPFEEKMLKSEEDLEALKKLVGTEASVPTITVGAQLIKGFESTGWNNLLDLAGYPKTAAFGSKPSGTFAK